MKIVEGYFEGTLIIPVIRKSVCHGHHDFQPGESFFVLQQMRLENTSWINCPANDLRVYDESHFTTCVRGGYYKFTIFGVLSHEEEEELNARRLQRQCH